MNMFPGLQTTNREYYMVGLSGRKSKQGQWDRHGDHIPLTHSKPYHTTNHSLSHNTDPSNYQITLVPLPLPPHNPQQIHEVSNLLRRPNDTIPLHSKDPAQSHPLPKQKDL